MKKDELENQEFSKEMLESFEQKTKKIVSDFETNRGNGLPNSISNHLTAKSKKSSLSTIDDFEKNILLLKSYELIYKPLDLNCTRPISDDESKLYAAYDFSLNHLKIKFRVGKSTPTKIGHFVTLWKRIGKNPIQPYDAQDQIDLIVICVQENENIGQFIFPKSILVSQDIFSSSDKGGKRAIRIYAPWIKTENLQAAKSQKWQTKYFLNLSDTKNIDMERAKTLYHLT